MLVRTRRARRRALRLVVGGVFALISAMVTAAPADATAAAPSPQPQKSEEIVITGSRIPRPNLTASSPVTVVDSKEVKLQGAVLTEQLINALPQVLPDQGAFLSNGASGTATVNLRGLEAV